MSVQTDGDGAKVPAEAAGAGAMAAQMPAPAAPADRPPTAPSQAPVRRDAALAADWLPALAVEVRHRLEQGEPDVWGALGRDFEAALIRVALEATRGRRIEAATRLGIGRNTITRKIQELGVDAG